VCKCVCVCVCVYVCVYVCVTLVSFQKSWNIALLSRLLFASLSRDEQAKESVCVCVCVCVCVRVHVTVISIPIFFTPCSLKCIKV
jgi:hypothetical protein